jgi:hypothetical protein
MYNIQSGAFEKLRKANMRFVISVCPSVRMDGTTLLPLDRFSLNFTFECKYFSKNCRENSSFIKFWKEYRVLYMKTYTFTTEHRWNLLIIRNVSDIRCRKNQNIHLTLSDPTSNLVRQYDFPVPLRCRKTSDTVLCLFSRCRSLSDAFRVVRTLANR